jgi:hypothetical protein
MLRLTPYSRRANSDFNPCVTCSPPGSKQGSNFKIWGPGRGGGQRGQQSCRARGAVRDTLPPRVPRAATSACHAEVTSSLGAPRPSGFIATWAAGCRRRCEVLEASTGAHTPRHAHRAPRTRQRKADCLQHNAARAARLRRAARRGAARRAAWLL